VKKIRTQRGFQGCGAGFTPAAVEACVILMIFLESVNRLAKRSVYKRMPTENPDSDFVRELTLHQGPILAYVRSLMGGCPGAQDILQQTNLVLWAKKDHFVPGTNFKSWAFAVARFEVLGQRKRLQRNGWLVFGEEVAEKFAQDLEEGPADWEDALRALEGCMGKLRPQDMELVQMRYASSCGLTEYAHTLQRSSGTLKARLFKIRAALRRCIENSLSSKPADHIAERGLST